MRSSAMTPSVEHQNTVGTHTITCHSMWTHWVCVCIWGVRQPVLSSLHFIKLWNCNWSKEVREDDVPVVSAQQQHWCYWPRKKTLPWGDFFQLLLAVLVHVANTESHEAAADQCHCGCWNHGDSTASNTNQEPQAHTEDDLGQLDHAGESSTVNAFPSPVLHSLHLFLQVQGLQRSTEKTPVKRDTVSNMQLLASAWLQPPGAAGQVDTSLIPFLYQRGYRGYHRDFTSNNEFSKLPPNCPVFLICSFPLYPLRK